MSEARVPAQVHLLSKTGLLLRPDSIFRGISRAEGSLPGSFMNLLPFQALCLTIMCNFPLSTSCAGHMVRRSPGAHTQMEDSVAGPGSKFSLENQKCSLRQCSTEAI